MVIKNKDGTPYKLQSPNPIMKEQDNFKDFVLHNCHWIPEVQVPKKVISIQPEKEEIVQEPPEDKIEIVEKIINPLAPHSNPNVTRIHCLPTKIEKKVDELYGETKLMIVYGDPFIFEAIVTGQNDFKIMFWTNINMLEKGSIIYPINKDKLWWKIDQKEESEGGYLYNGYLSDIHPDFSS